ncbi:MAG: hypothetical protein QF450_06625 [Rhodospirillales bacterium]|jgi:hypothetical protein|nr:hypothetical protein [Rhodospirillales bacterium]
MPLRYAPQTMTARRHAIAALFLAVLSPATPAFAAGGLEEAAEPWCAKWGTAIR